MPSNTFLLLYQHGFQAVVKSYQASGVLRSGCPIDGTFVIFLAYPVVSFRHLQVQQILFQPLHWVYSHVVVIQDNRKVIRSCRELFSLQPFPPQPEPS